MVAHLQRSSEFTEPQRNRSPRPAMRSTDRGLHLPPTMGSKGAAKSAYVSRPLQNLTCDKRPKKPLGESRIRDNFEAMMTSEQCRAYAAECRQQIRTAVSPQKKRVLLDLTHHWDMAANDMEELQRQKAAQKATT